MEEPHHGKGNAVEVEPKAEETTDPEVTVIEGVKVEE